MKLVDQTDPTCFVISLFRLLKHGKKGLDSHAKLVDTVDLFTCSTGSLLLFARIPLMRQQQRLLKSKSFAEDSLRFAQSLKMMTITCSPMTGHLFDTKIVSAGNY